VKFHGGCHGCSSSKATLKGGIETLIKQNFPEIIEVVDVTDHTTGDAPYLT
jgi:Fe/S biogenesis protein NfuA